MNSRSCIILLIFINHTSCFFIENFNENGDVSAWQELSDTVMKEGKSKASFVLQETNIFKRAVLFTLLNPQNCGAAVAGFKKNVQLDISSFTKITIQCRGQGQYRNFKFFFRHRGNEGMNTPSFIHFFEAPKYFEAVSLDISKFQSYKMGQPTNFEPLDTKNITTIGILAFGGFSLPKKQNGVACLEIDWIKLD